MAFRYVGHLYFHDRNAPFHPEEPIVVDKDINPDDKFTFIDVVPGMLKPSSGYHVGAKRQSAVYNNFSSLVDTANEWLSKNQCWEVINLETVLLFFKNMETIGFQLVPEDTCFPLDGEVHSSIMALRLWLKKRDEDEKEAEDGKHFSGCQTLKYMDFVPKADDEDDNSRFEKLDVIIENANKAIKEGKIDGKILTIETLYFPANADWQIDPELTLHIFPTKCVSIIRIFFEKGAVCTDVVGIKDYVPKLIGGGGFFKKPEFEQFSECMQRASEWLSENPECDLKNAQCLEVKIKSITQIDTQIMSHSADRGDYIRIFRLAYTKCANNSESPPPPPIFLSSVIFTPAGQDATVHEIKRKMHDWVVAAMLEVNNSSEDDATHRPRLLSAETVEIFTKQFSDEDIQAETENTFQFNRIGTMNSFLFVAFRVYFDVGFYGKKCRSKSISSTISHHKTHDANCQLM